MKYLSVCSGIEAATVAWHPLGWTPAAFSEIEKFPRAVLAHRFPDVPCHGDFTTISEDDYGSIDLLVGGTPCQDFSVAGLRAGIAGDRGNLTLEFLRLAARKKPRWIVWENVPGVLSSDGGRALGAFLGGLAELGYGFAYRVLDAQHFGLAQRRQRVFVVGYLGDWRRAAAVLFERESLLGHPAPRRKAGERVTPVLASGAHGSNGAGIGLPGDPSFTLDTSGAGGLIQETVATLDAQYGRLQGASGQDALHGHSHLVPHAFDARQSDVIQYGDMTGPLDTDGYTMAVAFALRGREGGAMPEIEGNGTRVGALRAASGGSSRDYVAFDTTQITSKANYSNPQPRRAAREAGCWLDDGALARTKGLPTGTMRQLWEEGPDGRSPQGLRLAQQLAKQLGTALPQLSPARASGTQVRRLTPRECERLMGFPDDWTLIPWRNGLAPDGPRYKALGNSMAVPCMHWIGKRIAMVEAFALSEAA